MSLTDDIFAQEDWSSSTVGSSTTLTLKTPVQPNGTILWSDCDVRDVITRLGDLAGDE